MTGPQGNATTAPAGLRRTFEPLRIGPVTVRNRVARTAHLTRYSVGTKITDDLIDYHVARGEGGVGLSIVEATAVHPSSVLGLVGFSDEILDGYHRLAERVRPTGMRLFQQLWHGGHVYMPPDGSAPRGASAIPGTISAVPAVPIATDEVAEFVAAFAEAARRSVSAGIEGIELAAGHGYLLHQFLSPLTNTREDRYGGTLANRMRFLAETLEAVRAAIGPGAALGVRISAGQVAADLTEDDLAEVFRTLVDRRLIDYINVSIGDYYQIAQQVGAMDRPAGYQLHSSGQITAASTAVPRLVTGRFRTLEEVEQVLAEGVADIVSMVRAHIADPDIVRKTVEGRLDEVRPCIGCNQGCIGRISGVDARMGCVVNPAVGREATLAETLIGTTADPKRVLVVGGGPAGIEAARTARLRGHEVILAEAQDSLGGSLNLLVKAPKTQGFDDIRHWLRDEVHRLGVDIRTSTYLDADDVLALAPDVLVVATGAEPNMDGRLVADPGRPVKGMELPHVISTVDLLSQPGRNWGRRAFLYDEMGQHEAVAVAEYLVDSGLDVVVSTRFPAFGHQMDQTLRLEPALQRFSLAPGAIRVIPRSRPLSFDDDSVTVESAGSVEPEVFPADVVVMVPYKNGRNELADEVRELAPGITVHVVGDALSARDLQVALRDGHLVGRSIE